MNRYSTQETLIGKEGQEKISRSTVAVVGLGALGSLSTQLLARSGIGKLIVIDRDYIELGNLHRQFFDEEDVGKPKATAVKEHLEKINSKVEVEDHFDNLDHTNAERLLKADLILDCTDNLETRFLINDISLKHKRPFIYAAALAESGYVYTIIPKERPCFECIFKEAKAAETCETAGVLNIITSAISVLQVNQAMKFILGKEVDPELFYFNSAKNSFDKIKVDKNPACEACKGIFKHLTGEKASKAVRFCGSNMYLIRGKFSYPDLKEKLSKVNALTDFGNVFLFQQFTVFKDGRALVKAEDEKEALSLFSRFIGN